MAKPQRRRRTATPTTAKPEQEAKPVRGSRRSSSAPAKPPVEEEEFEEEDDEEEEDVDDDLPEVLGGKKEEKQVAVRKPSLPAKRDNSGAKLGLEDLDADDLIIPYMKIMQPTSPEVLDRKHEAQMGDLVNSLSSYLYPEEVYFVPIKALKRRILYYKRDDKENSGIECGSRNFKTPDSGKKYAKMCAMCPKAQFKANGDAPECNILLSFISKVLGLPEGDEGNALVAITFTKTSFKAGKILASLAQSAKGNLFNNIYKLTTQDKENDKGVFAILKVSPYGQVPDEDVPELYNMYEMLTTTDYELVEEDYKEFDGDSSTSQGRVNDMPPEADDIPDIGDDDNPFA